MRMIMAMMARSDGMEDTWCVHEGDRISSPVSLEVIVQRRGYDSPMKKSNKEKILSNHSDHIKKRKDKPTEVKENILSNAKTRPYLKGKILVNTKRPPFRRKNISQCKTRPSQRLNTGHFKNPPRSRPAQELRLVRRFHSLLAELFRIFEAEMNKILGHYQKIT